MNGAAYSIDGRTADRASFYAVACDPRRSVVVEACAGAGKTWMLVSRVLRTLLDGAEPHEILAITFTRKAAGEMRARLDEWLAEYGDPACTEEHRVAALCERGLDAAAAAAAAPVLAGLHERLLEAGRAVEIRTFHAWFSQLLRAAPLTLLAELGLRPEMEIVDDLADHRGAVFVRFHAAVLADAALLADYRELVLQRGRSQATAWLDAAWAKRTEIELADAAGTLAGSVPAAAEACTAFAGLARPVDRLDAPLLRTLLASVAKALGSQTGVKSRSAGSALAEAAADADAATRLVAIDAALFTRKGTLRKNVDAPGLAELLAQLDDIRRAVAQQQAHEEHGRMVRLSRCLLVELAAYKRERGLAEMADLEGCALALLRDATLAGWVQQRLDARIRHLLIDEFQDTSPLQWHALHAWLSGYAGAGGGASGQRPPGVFIVGDPKQSIYRFRRAEPRVFDAARQFVVDALGGTVLGCDHTRRNAPELLAALNRVFGEAQQAGEFEGFRNHTTERAPAAATTATGVFALPLIARLDKAEAEPDDGRWRDTLGTPRLGAVDVQRQREADAVADAISARLAADPAFGTGDVMVLCRKRESLRLLAAALAARQLPFVAPEDLSLVDSPEVLDLVALLDALASPGQALSLARALRSPLLGASDDDLVAIATAARGQGGDWWQALQRLAAPSQALQRARGLLTQWQQAAQALPPHDLLDRIVEQGELLPRTLAAVPLARRAGALAAIEALLQQALALDGARYATPYGFVRALKRRRIRMPAGVQRNAVSLLTIHGAKGLEAPLVFVMDTQPEPKNPDTATLLVDWPVELAHPRRCAFVYAESHVPPSLAALLATELAARQREELNSLYVAMTRAREALVLSATEPHRPSALPPWWQRVAGSAGLVTPPWLAATAGPAGKATRAADTGVRLQVLPAWRPAPPTALPAAAAAADTVASQLGRAVHRTLEWLGQPGSSATLAAASAAAAAEFASDARQVERIAAAILGSPACARFFGGAALRWAGNEVAVSEGGELLRIDRLVALDEAGEAGEAGSRHWWVLDYKLAQRADALAVYRPQMQRYRRAVERLQPGEPVHCAFITGGGVVVEIDSD